MKPLVTVAMPTYNRGEFIAGAVECFLSQTFADSELVIVDDGDDLTRSIMSRSPFADNARILYRWVDCKNRPFPTGEKRNMCADMARGSIIVHMDSDDWYSPAYVGEMVALLQRSGKQVVGLHETLYWHMEEHQAYKYTAEDLPYAMGNSLTYYRDYWQKVPFDSGRRIGEDSNFSFCAHVQGQLASYPCGDLVVARAHRRNTSTPCLRTKYYTRLNPQDLPAGFWTAQNMPHSITFEQYIRQNAECGVIDFALRKHVDHEGKITFYIHPANVSGDTVDYIVEGNLLTMLHRSGANT